jgi:hypothetical protein
MARTVGRVEILVDFDGNRLPAQARALAEKAGTQAGDGFNERFEARFSKLAQQLLPEMQEIGRLGGNRISNAMMNEIDKRLDGVADRIAKAFISPSSLDNFAENFDRVDDAALQLRQDLQLLRDEGSLNDAAFGSFHRTLNTWIHRAREAERQTDELNEVFRRMRADMLPPLPDLFDKAGKAANKAGDDAEGSGLKWKSLGHNLRQAIVIVAAVAAAGEQIATLGSAAGSGLVVLGASAVTGATGLGVMVAAIGGLKSQLDDLAERDELLNILPEDLSDEQLARIDELQAKIAGFDPALASVQNLAAGFEGLGTQITNAFINGAGPSIDNFVNTTLPSLRDGLVNLSSVAGDAMTDLLDRLSSPEGQEAIERIFKFMEQQFPVIIATISNLGSALGGVFIAAGPYVQNFLDSLERLTGEFDDWVNSIEGQTSLNEWFENGERVLGAFADLLGEVGEMFGNLVDEESVDRTVRFLENLIDLIEPIGSRLNFLGELDPFGLLASSLFKVFGVLGPVFDALAPLAGILTDLATTANEALAPAVLLLQAALLPMQIAFEAIGYVVQVVTEYITSLYEALGPAEEALDGVAASAFERMKPALDAIAAAIITLLPSPEELARIINDQVIPAIELFAEWLSVNGVAAAEALLTATVGLVDFLSNDLPKVLAIVEFWSEQFVRFMLGPVGIVLNLIDAINTLNNTPVTGGGGGGSAPLFQAAGGINLGPTWSMTGEEGPEAIVPLSRDLSKVDPSVRWLSAIAQGKDAPSAPGGGDRTIIESGAIQVIGVRDGRQAASAVLDRIVAHAGS